MIARALPHARSVTLIEERILVLTPSGNDAAQACTVLRQASLLAQPCENVDEMVVMVQEGAGMIIIAEEALVASSTLLLFAMFTRQQAWSDLPMVLLTSGGELTQHRIRTLDMFRESCNMILLERPFRPLTLISVAQVALRGRHRQYQVRTLLQQFVEKESDLARSNEELEQFAHIASHDLQEPLRMITSYLQLLGRRHGDELDEKSRQYMQFVIDGARRMQDLIGAILQLSQTDSENECKMVNFQCVFNDTLGNLAVMIGESSAIVVARDLPTISAMPALMVQLLQNLVSNAIKFRSKLPPFIEVSAVESSNAWTFSVIDNGIGIRPEDSARLFKIFQRLHATDRYPGSGIGLATCKKIVERHGGRIWVTSSFGKGATFSFTLPK